MKITVSVPGKIHLMGEHAIVYGKPAILSAINLRLYATISPNKKLQIITKDETRLIEKAVEIVVQKFNLKTLPKVKIEIESQIPTGRHAGSSAAVSVATVAVLTYYLKKIWDLNLFNDLAYEVEKFQHGNPSGGDNSTCTFGGFIWYRKEFEFLKNITRLDLTTPPFFKKIILVDTGRPKENTGQMVDAVSQFLKNHPQKGTELLDENEEATREIVMAFRENDDEKFIKAIKKGEKTLEQLGVVSRKAREFIRELGILGGAAKILGGGGKKEAAGLLLCYSKKKNLACRLAQKFGYETYTIKLGEQGVRLESN